MTLNALSSILRSCRIFSINSMKGCIGNVLSQPGAPYIARLREIA